MEAFRLRVHGDPALARTLRMIEPGRFADEALRIAAELDCEVSVSDLEEALALGRREWGLRWVL